ncbi:MAG: hypothetical protein ACLFU7_12835, partial [Armatimonadota bacterium]
CRCKAAASYQRPAASNGKGIGKGQQRQGKGSGQLPATSYQLPAASNGKAKRLRWHKETRLSREGPAQTRF